MEDGIPKATLCARPNLPWLTKQIKRAMKQRDKLFKKKPYSLQYRKARSKVVTMLRAKKGPISDV